MRNVCTSCGRVKLISEMQRVESVNAVTFKLEECFKSHKCSQAANNQHTKPESTIEADSCRHCETQKDKDADTLTGNAKEANK